MVFYFGKIFYKKGEEKQRLPHLFIIWKFYVQQNLHYSDIITDELTCCAS